MQKRMEYPAGNLFKTDFKKSPLCMPQNDSNGTDTHMETVT